MSVGDPVTTARRAAVSVPCLGPLESAVMEVIWRARAPVTGRTCRERLDYQTRDGEGLSYTTVMVILASPRKMRMLTRVLCVQDSGRPEASAISVPFERATELARLRKISRPMLRLIFHGIIAATLPIPAAASPLATSCATWASAPTTPATSATRPAATRRTGFP